MPKVDWYLVTSHGAALFYIVLHPGCSADEVAQVMPLSRGRVMRILSDLRRAGMVRVRKQGRRSCYTANSRIDFRHPKLKKNRLLLHPRVTRPEHHR